MWRGHRVLVLAGSGGVGTMAIQLAKARGAYVITTTSADNFDLVTSLGADEVFDYRTQDVFAHVSDLDFALCTLGHGDRERALAAVKPGGTVVSLVADIPGDTARFGPVLGVAVAGVWNGVFLARAKRTGRRAVQLTRSGDGHMLDALTSLIEAGAVRPVIASVLPLNEVVSAHRASERGDARGKIVLQVR